MSLTMYRHAIYTHPETASEPISAPSSTPLEDSTDCSVREQEKAA